MSAHTPGPWSLAAVIDRSIVHFVPVAEGLSLLTVVHEGGAPFGAVYIDGDACLIAAAPDLLADLREAAATLRRYESLHRAKGTDESIVKANVNAAMAARFESTIAKATGATP